MGSMAMFIQIKDDESGIVIVNPIDLCPNKTEIISQGINHPSLALCSITRVNGRIDSFIFKFFTPLPADLILQLQRLSCSFCTLSKTINLSVNSFTFLSAWNTLVCYLRNDCSSFSSQSENTKSKYDLVLQERFNDLSNNVPNKAIITYDNVITKINQLALDQEARVKAEAALLDSSIYSQFLQSIYENNTPIFRAHIDKNIKLNPLSRDITPLLTAINHKNFEMVAFLLVHDDESKGSTRDEKILDGYLRLYLNPYSIFKDDQLKAAINLYYQHQDVAQLDEMVSQCTKQHSPSKQLSRFIEIVKSNHPSLFQRFRFHFWNKLNMSTQTENVPTNQNKPSPHN